jgi:hypothetical protein
MAMLSTATAQSQKNPLQQCLIAFIKAGVTTKSKSTFVNCMNDFMDKSSSPPDKNWASDVNVVDTVLATCLAKAFTGKNVQSDSQTCLQTWQNTIQSDIGQTTQSSNGGNGGSGSSNQIQQQVDNCLQPYGISMLSNSNDRAANSTFINCMNGVLSNLPASQVDSLDKALAACLSLVFETSKGNQAQIESGGNACLTTWGNSVDAIMGGSGANGGNSDNNGGNSGGNGGSPSSNQIQQEIGSCFQPYSVSMQRNPNDALANSTFIGCMNGVLDYLPMSDPNWKADASSIDSALAACLTRVFKGDKSKFSAGEQACFQSMGNSINSHHRK